MFDLGSIIVSIEQGNLQINIFNPHIKRHQIGVKQIGPSPSANMPYKSTLYGMFRQLQNPNDNNILYNK